MRSALLVGVLLMLACSSRPPRRPEGLPAAAVWVGKGKSGRFVEVGSREGSLWTLAVYEAQGQRHPATRWRLQGFARASLEPQEIAGFQEGALLLQDGSRLVPVP